MAAEDDHGNVTVQQVLDAGGEFDQVVPNLVVLVEDTLQLPTPQFLSNFAVWGPPSTSGICLARVNAPNVAAAANVGGLQREVGTTWLGLRGCLASKESSWNS